MLLLLGLVTKVTPLRTSSVPSQGAL